jgi:hypothetical protein
MFDEDARGALFRYLGYDETPKGQDTHDETPAETPAEIPAEIPKTSITAEEMFASPRVDETPVDETPVETPADMGVSSETIRRFIVTGDFASAVDLCFSCGNSADALVIAGWGGAALLQSATVSQRSFLDSSHGTWSRLQVQSCGRWSEW